MHLLPVPEALKDDIKKDYCLPASVRFFSNSNPSYYYTAVLTLEIIFATCTSRATVVDSARAALRDILEAFLAFRLPTRSSTSPERLRAWVCIPNHRTRLTLTSNLSRKAQGPTLLPRLAHNVLTYLCPKFSQRPNHMNMRVSVVMPIPKSKGGTTSAYSTRVIQTQSLGARLAWIPSSSSSRNSLILPTSPA